MSFMRLFRPLTLSDLVQWTGQIYVRHLRQWLLLAALVLIPLAFVNGLAVAWMFDRFDALDPAILERLLNQSPDQDLLLDPDVQAQLIQAGLGVLAFVAAWAGSQIVLGIVLGGAGSALAAASFRGEGASLGRALNRALFTRGGALIGGTLLVWISMAALVGLSSIVVCMGILVTVAMIALYLVWVPLLPPVLVLEEGPLTRLLARAWYFAKKRIWLVLAASLSLLALRFAFSLLLALGVGPLLTLLGPESDALAVASGQVADVIVQAVLLPLGVIFFTLFYEDSRLRLESEVDSFGPEAAAPFAAPPEPPLTAADLPRLAGVVLVIMVGGFFLLQTLTLMAALMSAF